MILRLNLPKPSENLIQIVYKNKSNHVDRQYMVKALNLKNEKANSAVHILSLPNDFVQAFNEEYQSFFTDILFPSVFVIQNINQPSSSSYPPHVDKHRLVALNYYVEQGGNDAETVFYKESLNEIHPELAKYRNLKGATAFYNQLTVDRSYRIPNNEWVALDVSKFHSVENIITTRTILSVGMLCSFDEFKVRYNSLVSPTGIEPVS